jgi:hypothetical protein
MSEEVNFNMKVMKLQKAMDSETRMKLPKIMAGDIIQKCG